MSEYKKIETSPEVWSRIQAQHHEKLVVFGSFSDPTGTFNGGPGIQGCMRTAYGFKGTDYPILEAKTTWTIDRDKPYERINEEHEYWLCVGMKED